MIILGIIIGLLLAILVVSTEIYIYQQRRGLIKDLQEITESYNPPKGLIIEPFNEKKEALIANLKDKEQTGQIITDEDITF